MIETENRVRIHVTDRDTFRRCRRLWGYKRGGLVPIGPKNVNLAFGIAAHETLARFYGALKVEEIWTDEDMSLAWAMNSRDLPADFQDLGRDVLVRYLQRYTQSDLDRYQILEVEKEVTYDVPSSNITLVGTMDLIVRDLDTNKIWVIDHKTYKEFVTQDHLEWDDQMTAYLFLARENGYNVQGAVYNMIRKAIPKQPSINQDGSVSVQLCDTTAELYEAALESSTKAPTEKHLERLASLKNGGDRFFRREYIYRTRAKLEDFRENLIGECHEMANPDTPLYPNFTRECPYCEMASLCRTQSDGGDVESVKLDLYQIEPLRD